MKNQTEFAYLILLFNSSFLKVFNQLPWRSKANLLTECFLITYIFR